MIMQDKLKLLVPSIADVIFLILFLILTLTPAGETLLADGDTGWHIKAGEYILDTMSVPRHDIFSFHNPSPVWTAHEWLSEVVMALIHKAFGLTGIVVFFSFVISLSGYLLFNIIRNQKGNFIVAGIIVSLVLSCVAIHWLARPHIFSLLFLIIWYYLLDAYQYDERNYLYCMPPLMFLWVNLHGGFILGFVLLGIYLGYDFLNLYASNDEEKERYKQKTKFLGITAGFCIFAALLNPYGYHMLFFPFKFISMKFMIDTITEFRSPNLHNLDEIPFEILLLLIVALFAVSRKGPNILELLLLILFAHMALLSVRNIPALAVISAPIIARQAEAVLKQTKGSFFEAFQKKANNIAQIDASAKGHLWLILPIAAVVIFAMNGQIAYTFDQKTKPLAAIEFLKREPLKGNMFNEYVFGDYIVYSAYPQYRVFIDGRADMYGEGKLKEYHNITGLKPGWESILEKYNVKWIIFNSDSMLSKILREKSEWKLIFADKVANIFVKNIPENRSLMKKYPDVRPVVPEDDKESN